MQPTNGQPTTDEPTGETTSRRVTVTEAAALLGLSEDAIRSRLKRGTLRKEKGRDGTVFVVLGAEDSTNRPTTNNDQPTTSQTPDQSALVEVLRDQVQYLREQLSEEREANRENRRIIAGLVQRVPELEPAREAPPEPRESDINASDRPREGDPPETEQRRSWLYRFFFGPER